MWSLTEVPSPQSALPTIRRRLAEVSLHRLRPSFSWPWGVGLRGLAHGVQGFRVKRIFLASLSEMRMAWKMLRKNFVDSRDARNEQRRLVRNQKVNEFMNTGPQTTAEEEVSEEPTWGKQLLMEITISAQIRVLLPDCTQQIHTERIILKFCNYTPKRQQSRWLCFPGRPSKKRSGCV